MFLFFFIFFKVKSVRIFEVVLDFIQDHSGKIWLINMKALKFEKTLPMSSITGVIIKNLS